MRKSRRIDQPEPAFFKTRLVRKGPWVGSRIYVRFGMLVAEINGAPADVDRVWTSGQEITEDEYLRLVANPPNDPMTPIDMNAKPPVF
jgi:hypothetical protein